VSRGGHPRRWRSSGYSILDSASRIDTLEDDLRKFPSKNLASLSFNVVGAMPEEAPNPDLKTSGERIVASLSLVDESRKRNPNIRQYGTSTIEVPAQTRDNGTNVTNKRKHKSDISAFRVPLDDFTHKSLRTGPELPKAVLEQWNKLGDLYQTLGVPQGADSLDIDAAAAKKYGDIYSGKLAEDDAWTKSPGDIRADAEKTFAKKYAEAHRILSDPEQRSEYNKLYNQVKEFQSRSMRRGLR
jgi:hypothetical protein